MPQPLKDAVGICKTIVRNGYDAYVINARFQEKTLSPGREAEVDICAEPSFDELRKIFPNAEPSPDASIIAVLSEGTVTFIFYPLDTEEGSYPEQSLAKLSPRMLRELEKRGEMTLSMACPYIPKATDVYDGFADLNLGEVRLSGLPDETLKQNYLRALRALRFSANFNLPVEPNTWMAVVRSARRVIDYVSVSDIMDEWRKVEAENMWKFVRLLYDATILHGLIPEVAALSRVRQIKNKEEGEENVFEHTIECMRRYPEELPFDWLGTMAVMFHDVGKLYTAEFHDGRWTFHQHAHVGAKVARKILTRLRFDPVDIDLICYLVANHLRFHFMLTDRGIRRFKALDEYPRLIEMARCDIKARDGRFTEFNHNMKMLERADIPEEMLEPLLNGNEIMEFTGLKPGPTVGVIREALLKAQAAGDVGSIPQAVEFVMNYQAKEKLK